MIEREELFDYIEDKYKVKPDHPWDTFENCISQVKSEPFRNLKLSHCHL